jgi:membrane protein DedA with SNARE-associated domain
MMDLTVASLLQQASNHPALQGAAIVIGTFILEDAATVLAAMEVQSEAISVWTALISLYIGIVLGDMGLYGLGRLAAAVPWARRLIPEQKQEHGRRWLDVRVFKVVFISRFLPGARLPTYTACGFFGASFTRFVLATSLATLIWTSALFDASLRVGDILMQYLGAWRGVGTIGFAVVVVLLGRLAARMARMQETR